MDAKEIKSLLKQARSAIDDKEYKTALKHCKAILKADKNNYNAWVFVGVAAQEMEQHDQAEAAFKKAIEIYPTQVLAWQGLCNFYEKYETKENQIKLLSAYKKLIELYDSDYLKKLEYYEKLLNLIKKLGDKEMLIRALKLKLEVVQNEKEKYIIQKEIFDELSGEINLSEYLKEVQTEALENLIEHEEFSSDYCTKIISACLETLYKNNQKTYAINLAQKIFAKFSENLACLKFLCLVALDLYVENELIFDGIKDIANKLTHFEPEGLFYLIQGFIFFIDKNYTNATQKFTEGLKLLESCFQAWYLLSKSQYILHQYQNSENSCKRGLEIAINSNASSTIIGKFYLILGQALYGKQNWNKALENLQKCVEYLGNSKEVLLAFNHTLLKIGKIEIVEQKIEEMKVEFENDPGVLQLEGCLYFYKKEFSQALLKLRQSLAQNESSFTLHLIGLILWESKEEVKAFQVFMKAVELDPYFYKNFLYIGHYYSNILCDKNKALCCYQKAFDLNNTDYECGIYLSSILKDLGKIEENIKVLKIITNHSPIRSCQWAWTQLGLQQLDKGDISDSIFSLQKAVNADISNSSSWECLGDAYLQRGSYESALRVFTRASELNPKAMYPLYQVSTIQKMRGFYLEAVEKYKNLLEINSTYVPALIGLAETWMLLARKSLNECLYGFVRDYCQKTLIVLSRIILKTRGLSCLWKIAGDACTLPYHLDDKWFPIRVPSELINTSDQEICDKAKLLSFGSIFFGRALSLKSDVSSLWHDLGVNCYFQSKQTKIDHERLNFAKKAFICFQKAISICPNNDAHWTALGVVALSKELQDYSLGQHVLIKSLEINKDNAETWTNLGILYLENENIELSHKAFTIAQSVEPTYPLSWIGQAFIAEKIKHGETMDLYRHATTLGSHNEALLGYSRIVCETLLNTTNKECEAYKYGIEEMDAIVAALDCSIKYTANNSNSPEAYNVLGMLFERENINNAALNAYKNSLELFKSSGCTENIEMVRANYARLLSVVGQTSESHQEFFLLKKIDSSLLCSMASASYKAEKYEEAYKLFAKAFELSTNLAEKSHIKVAMALVAIKLQSQNVPKPLTLLFESTKIQPASVQGLLALFSYGILQNEFSLAGAAQKELMNYKFHKDYSTSIAFLSSTLTYKLKGVRAGRNELLKYLHCIPNSGSLWLQVASCLLQWDRSYANIAANCTKFGVLHKGDRAFASQIFALSQISAGYRKGALAASQKAIHMYPDRLANWITLAATSHVVGVDRKICSRLFTFAKNLMIAQRYQKADLNYWLLIMEVFHQICDNNMVDANNYITRILQKGSFPPEILSIFHILDAVVKVFSSKIKVDPLILAVKNNSKTFLGWHILSQILLGSGKFNEAEKTLSQFTIIAEKIFPKWQIFPLLQLAALSYQALHVNKDEREKWLKLGETSISKAIHIAPSNQAAHFLRGLISLESKNMNLAKRSFEKMLTIPQINENEWMGKAARHLLVSIISQKKSDNALKDLGEKFPNDKELNEIILKYSSN